MPAISGGATNQGMGMQLGNGVWMQAAAGAASGIFDRLAQRIGVNYDNRKQLEQQRHLSDLQLQYDTRLMDIQQQKQMQMWRDTSYPAQMEQLIKAGLNPALMYGEGGGGGTTSGSGMPSISSTGAENPKTHGQGMGMMQNALLGSQLALMQAQKENIQADTANKQGQAANQPITGENIQANTALTKANQEATQLSNKYNNGTLEQRIANVANDASRIMAEARSAMTNANIQGASQEIQIQQLKANLTNTIMNTALQGSQSQLAQSNIHLNTEQIANWTQQNSLKYIEISGNQEEQIKARQRQIQQDLQDNLNLPAKAAQDIADKIMQGLFIGGIYNKPAQLQNKIEINEKGSSETHYQYK